MRLLPDEVSEEKSEVSKEIAIVEEPVTKPSCKERAKKPGDKCYFMSEAYFAKKKEEKLKELWAEILVDDEPRPYYWAE